MISKDFEHYHHFSRFTAAPKISKIKYGAQEKRRHTLTSQYHIDTKNHPCPIFMVREEAMLTNRVAGSGTWKREIIYIFRKTRKSPIHYFNPL